MLFAARFFHFTLCWLLLFSLTAEPALSANRLKAYKRLNETPALNDLFEDVPDQYELQRANPKFAALVVDATAGQILHEQKAEAIRHPASLTKMMTLYLLFDALKRKKISLNTKMRVSKKAATQPPTNIRLKKGQRIRVKKAIDALIIRSANDVALVVAEHLGKSQSGFARKMNRTAKKLGMKKTKFYNPHGLPDKRQVTTAMDMAKLAIALRRDFPDYYHYFKRKSFTHAGKKYTSHNKVVGRYPGADGLKTGYIRMAGFNLVTSITRGSKRYIGVVLGGKSSSMRDQEMMNMLDRTIFKTARGREVDGLRLAKAKIQPTKKLPAKKEAEKPVQKIVKKPIEPLISQGDTAEPPLTSRPWLKPAVASADLQDITIHPTVPPPTAPALKQVIGEEWAVQVGAFPTESQAHTAANQARNVAPKLLGDRPLLISMVIKDGRVFNRSRLIHLTNDEARTACDQLASQKRQCMVVRLD